MPWVAACGGSPLAWLRSGASGVLGPLGRRDELEDAALLLLERMRAAEEISPLTGLPGNSAIRRALEETVLAAGHPAAYIDITDFKPFNDCYGFAAGDTAIRLLASCLTDRLVGCFVGHIGGDDFLCAGPGQALEAGLSSAAAAFRSAVPMLYGDADRAAGGIEALDRWGRYRFFGFLDICISIVTPGGCATVEELAARAGREKKRRRGDPVLSRVSDVLPGRPEESVGALEAALGEGRLTLADAKAVLEAAGVTGDGRMRRPLASFLSCNAPPGLRKSAALSLGALGDPASADALTAALSDASPHVRTRAVEAVAVSGLPGASGAARAAMGDRSSWVRRAALRSLGSAGGEEALDALLGSARDGCGGRSTRDLLEERMAALDGLASLASPLAGPALLEMAEDPCYRPREELWRAIARCGTDECAVALADEASHAGEAASALPFLRPDPLGEKARGKVEQVSLDLAASGGNCAIPALICLASSSAPASHAVREGLLTLLRTCGGRTFSFLLTALEKRQVAIPASLVECVSARVRRDPDLVEREALLAFIRHAAGSGIPPGAFLGLLRHPRREVSVAAARAVLSALEAALGGPEGSR